MTVCKKHLKRICTRAERGASVLEVMLAITVVISVSPFLYSQIIGISKDVQDIAMANKIVKNRDKIVNFLRINQTQWPDTVEIQLTDEEVAEIAPMAHAGFIDKYKVNGATITDVYLAFNINDSEYRTVNIAKHIGADAAVVRDDGVAYSQSWAVVAPDVFNNGDLIFRISRDFEGSDKSRFLHRGTMGEDGLNQMQRDLHMNNFNIFNIGDISSLSAKIFDADTVFLTADVVDADTVYFSSGANISSDSIKIGSMRVTGDASGFNTITANKLNNDKYVTNGRLTVDSANVYGSVNVAGNMVLKSSSSKTITGFNGITTSNLLTPYISAVEMLFADGFGLTVSGELLVSTIAPLQIGTWVFPTNVPPSFSKLILTRSSVPSVPDAQEFKKITSANWHIK